MGRGANAIISMLHHFFEVHSFGERRVHLHADNCVGQNMKIFNVLSDVASNGRPTR